MLSPSVERFIEEAQVRWPTIAVNGERVAGHFATFGYEAQLPSHPLDLYLAYAALTTVPEACAELERTYLVPARAKVQHLLKNDALADDALQHLREKLWVGPPPALASYTGASPLSAWINTIAKRCAVDELRRLARQHKRIVPTDAESAPHEPQGRAPESLLDFERGHDLFNAAVTEAIKALSPRDRVLLRLHYRDGVSAEAIGRAYGVHRATATRWLTQLRATILAATQARIEQNQPLRHGEFAGLAAGLHDQVELVLSSWYASKSE